MLQKLIAAILLVSLMLGAGLQADRAAFGAVISKWRLLWGALAANFIIVPLLGVLIAWSLHVRDMAATGLLLMAMCPGVPFVILSGGRKHGGSQEFAVALAVILPALSVLTVPITAGLALPEAERPDIPPSFVISLVLYQLVPLILGMIASRRLPTIAERLVRPLGYVTLAAFLGLLVLLIPAMVRGVTTVFGTFGLIAMLLTVALSYVAGWILGAPREEYRRTLAVGTALRNPAVAMLIATTRFPGTTVAASVAAYFFVQIVVTALAGKLLKRPA